MARVPKTRNAGTWSSSRYWQQVRSGLRKAFQWWKPMQNALKAARVPVSGPRGQKWAFKCSDCGKMFLRKNIQIHHKIEVGSLKKPEDLAGFLERLTCEDQDGYVVVCKPCHQKLHAK